MSTTISFFNKPTTNLIFFPALKPCKPISPSKLPTYKLLSSRELVSRKSFSYDIRGLNAKPSKFIRAQIFRGSTGEEEIGALNLEQRGFIDDGSSEIRPNFTTHELESTLNGLSKWFVVALFGTVILWRRDSAALWAAMGAFLNVGLSVTLKQILNQERPLSTLKSDPGMPSSHAQSIFFNVMFAIMTIKEWLGLNRFTTIFVGILLAVGSYLSWLRFSQRYHTISQVVVGAVAGSIFFMFWFYLWDKIVLKAFIAHLWVRIIVAFGATGSCLLFVSLFIQSVIEEK